MQFAWQADTEVASGYYRPRAIESSLLFALVAIVQVVELLI